MIQRRPRHLVSDGLVVDDELPLALVQDAQQLLVQDHLAQLQLHPSYRQLDQLRNVVELYAAERLWDSISGAAINRNGRFSQGWGRRRWSGGGYSSGWLAFSRLTIDHASTAAGAHSVCCLPHVT